MLSMGHGKVRRMNVSHATTFCSETCNLMKEVESFADKTCVVSRT